MVSDYFKEYYQDKFADRVEYAIKKLGGKCVQCGSTGDLEFDHIDPSNKKAELGTLWGHRIEVFDAELIKCQLLCKKCHKKKTNKEQNVEHGGGVSGKGGCKCKLCKAKKAEYMRKYYLTQGQRVIRKRQGPKLDHGGGTQGLRGCYCKLCKTRKAEYMKEYKARKAAKETA